MMCRTSGNRYMVCIQKIYPKIFREHFAVQASSIDSPDVHSQSRRRDKNDGERGPPKTLDFGQFEFGRTSRSPSPKPLFTSQSLSSDQHSTALIDLYRHILGVCNHPTDKVSQIFTFAAFVGNCATVQKGMFFLIQKAFFLGCQQLVVDFFGGQRDSSIVFLFLTLWKVQSGKGGLFNRRRPRSSSRSSGSSTNNRKSNIISRNSRNSSTSSKSSTSSSNPKSSKNNRKETVQTAKAAQAAVSCTNSTNSTENISKT